MARVLMSLVAVLLAAVVPARAVLHSSELRAVEAQEWLPKANGNEGRAGSNIGRKVPPSTGKPSEIKLNFNTLRSAAQSKVKEVVGTGAAVSSGLTSAVTEKVRLIKENLPALKKRFKDLGEYLRTH
uniref:Uncharacterized protein n=1 Tax=Alexandrium andersonii TaxID=327968 RepID=A0A7S2ACZ0_9DINO|mmetsp:Transcript_101090/g.226685  ORF Transcript_101090/g.226685 Transcript_101090/m.226685 type:complete len:127 (+) Transcript_101090:93-473(+)